MFAASFPRSSWRRRDSAGVTFSVRERMREFGVRWRSDAAARYSRLVLGAGVRLAVDGARSASPPRGVFRRATLASMLFCVTAARRREIHRRTVCSWSSKTLVRMPSRRRSARAGRHRGSRRRQE